MEMIQKRIEYMLKVKYLRTKKYLRKNQKIYLKGIYGSMEIDISKVSDKEMLLSMLLAGELVHVGSNTSFGFGKYKIEITT